MTKNLLSIAIVSLIIIGGFFISVCPVEAADFRGGDTLTVEEGEVLNEDLYIAGNEITIDGTVNGDLWAVGNTITVNGQVTGSIVAAGQTVVVNGQTGHSAKLGGQLVKVTGPVEGDLFMLGSNLTLSASSRVGADLFLAAGSAGIRAPVAGNLKGAVGTLIIASGVEGNVDVEVDNLTIASSGAVGGNLEYRSFNEVEIEQGGTVAGTINQIIPEEPVQKGFFASVAGIAAWKIISFAMILLIGIILVLVAPYRLIAMAGAIRTRPWQSLGWGAVVLFATPVAIIVVLITVIGIPLGLITAALYAIAIYLSQIPVALLIGWLILRHSHELDSPGIRIGALVLGLAILILLRIVPVLGFIVGLFTTIFGLGSIVTSTVRIKAEHT